VGFFHARQKLHTHPPNNPGENGPGKPATDSDEPRPVVHFRISIDITNEQKVDDILHGLVKRIGKEWRPAVPGMTPAGK